MAKNKTEITGRILVTLSSLLTAAYPIVGDWNERHTFAPSWPAHAQFHGAAETITAVLLAGLCIWLSWRSGGDERFSLLIAALILVAKWLPFYFAAMVPGTSSVNPPHQMFATLGGIPVNQSYPMILAVAGYLLARRGIVPRQGALS